LDAQRAKLIIRDGIATDITHENTALTLAHRMFAGLAVVGLVTFGCTSCVGFSPGPLTIHAVSDPTPAPLQALTLSVSGLGSGPVSVQISGRDGFVSTATAISAVGSSVVIAVPFAGDPKTGAVSPGPVRVVLKQAGAASAAFPFTIANLPSFGGTPSLPLGTVSHAFLAYQALQLGQRINELQAGSIKLGHIAAISTDIAATQRQLHWTLASIADISRISRHPTSVITGDHLPNGTPVSFGRQSVAMMDSIFGQYMLAEFGSVVPHTSAARIGQPGSITLTAATSADQLSLLERITKYITAAGDAYDTTKQIQRSDNWVDSTVAVTKGALAYLALAKDSPLSELTGAFFSIADIGASGLTTALDLGNLYYDTTYSNSNDAVQRDEVILQGDQAKLMETSWNTLVSTLSIGLLKGVTGEGAAGSYQIGGMGVLASDWVHGAASVASDATEAIAKQFDYANPMGNGFAVYPGNFPTSFDSTSLCCFGPSSVSTLQDEHGGYEEIVPLYVTATDYFHMRLTDVNPLTGTQLSHHFVDLWGLNTGKPFSTPTPILRAPPPVRTPPVGASGPYNIPAGTYDISYCTYGSCRDGGHFPASAILSAIGCFNSSGTTCVFVVNKPYNGTRLVGTATTTSCSPGSPCGVNVTTWTITRVG
jgi:hypothetical protein